MILIKRSMKKKEYWGVLSGVAPVIGTEDGKGKISGIVDR
jgi:hypothetical protein